MENQYEMWTLLTTVEMTIPIPINTTMIHQPANADQQFRSNRKVNVMTVIEVRDQDSSGCLCVELRDLLNAAEAIGRTLRWRLHDIEARGDIERFWPAGMLNFEATVKNAAQGLELGWTDLVALAEVLEQTIDCKLVGSDAVNNVELLVIEAVDSGYWRVATCDASAAGKIGSRFADVRHIS
jgi:hypothetical protein